MDIHCGRPGGGFGDQIHQVHARHISLVDAMVSDRVVVGTVILTLIVMDTFPSQYILFLQANDMSLDEISINLTLTTIHSFPLTRYHVFGFLWITQFCIACQHLVIAGSVAGWYFSK